MEDGRVQFAFAADDDAEAAAVAAQAEGAGAVEVDVKSEGAGFFPLAFGALVVGYMALAGFIALLKDWSDNRKKQGILISFAADGKINVQSIPIPYGQIVLVTKDGQWLRYENVDPNNLGDLVAKLAAGLIPEGGTATSAAESGVTKPADKPDAEAKPAQN